MLDGTRATLVNHKSGSLSVSSNGVNGNGFKNALQIWSRPRHHVQEGKMQADVRHSAQAQVEIPKPSSNIGVERGQQKNVLRREHSPTE